MNDGYGPLYARQVISVPVVPIGKPRMTQRDRWKERPCVVSYHDYCDQLRKYLPDFELPDSIFLTFFIPMPKSWTKRERELSLGKPHDQKPDVDNCIKAFLDAFKSEDKHVYAVRAEKYWSETGEIAIRPYDEIQL